MAIYLKTVIGAINSIVRGESEYLLVSKEEYDVLKRDAASPVPAPAPVPPTPAPPPQEPKKYKEIRFGDIDPFDTRNQIEPNIPIYYIPVGDGLYRATQDRRIFLLYCCYTLFKNKLVDEDTFYGDQLKCLLDNGFHMFDICSAIKAKSKDIESMVTKDNNEAIPVYIRNMWKLGFAPTCPWHPTHINLAKLQNIREEKSNEALRALFDEEDNKEKIKTKPSEDIKVIDTSAEPLLGKKYKHSIMRFPNETIDWTEEANKNVLVCYFRGNGVRGQGKAVLNMDAVTRWLSEDKTLRINTPFKNIKELNVFLNQHNLPVRAFIEGFGRKYATTLAFSKELCDTINSKVGFEFIANTAKKNVKVLSKENKPKAPVEEKKPKPQEPEYIRGIRRALWSERKWGITTIKKLMVTLEPVADRQQIIELFNISEYELNHPCELTMSTATAVNKFAGKAVCYGRA